MLLAATTEGGFTPLWPYVVGGIAAILTTLFGVWRLYKSWRADIEAETEKKVTNTKALEENTSAIGELTKRFDGWEGFMRDAAHQLTVHSARLDGHDRRLDELDRKTDPRLSAPRGRRYTHHPDQGGTDGGTQG